MINPALRAILGDRPAGTRFVLHRVEWTKDAYADQYGLTHPGYVEYDRLHRDTWGEGMGSVAAWYREGSRDAWRESSSSLRPLIRHRAGDKLVVGYFEMAAGNSAASWLQNLRGHAAPKGEVRTARPMR